MNPDTMKLTAAAQQTVDATAPTENYQRTPTALGPQLEDPPNAATARAALTVAAAVLVTMTAAAEAAVVGDHHMALAEELVAAAIVEVEATRRATSPATHVAAMVPAKELRKFVTKRLMKQTSAMLPHLLRSTSRSAAPREIQASQDHQVRREARPNSVA
jgi:hypothetical protein